MVRLSCKSEGWRMGFCREFVVATKTHNQTITANHFDAKVWIAHRQGDKGRIDLSVC